jgi:hypothetical protein
MSSPADSALRHVVHSNGPRRQHACEPLAQAAAAEAAAVVTVAGAAQGWEPVRAVAPDVAQVAVSAEMLRESCRQPEVYSLSPQFSECVDWILVARAVG